MDLSIIIVNWNSLHYVKQCIESINRNSNGLDLEIIVVDNASRDQKEIVTLNDMKNVRTIKNENNIGFPAANNLGFAIAKGKYILMLNPDTIIKEGTLQKSISKLRSDLSIGCLGVKTLKADGSILFHCARQAPSFMGIIITLFYVDKLFPTWKFLGSPDMPYWDHKDSREVDLLHGGYMMFAKELYQKIGGLDTRIPMYYEDIEFCLRIKKAGYKVFYLADAEIIHYTGKSSKKAPKSWIISLTYEIWYHYIYEYQGGKNKALQYLWFIILTAPIRLIWMQFVALGIYMKRKEIKFYYFFLSVLISVKWSINMLLNRHGK